MRQVRLSTLLAYSAYRTAGQNHEMARLICPNLPVVSEVHIWLNVRIKAVVGAYPCRIHSERKLFGNDPSPDRTAAYGADEAL